MCLKSEQLFITIINNPAIQETMFKGLFVAARRYIGYSPRGSSYPFTTGVYQILKNPESLFKGVYIGRSTLKGSHCESDFWIRCNVAGSDAFSTAIRKDLIECGLEAGEAAETIRGHDPAALTESLISYYWADMVKFAKVSAAYRPDWQTVAMGS